jgi:predicted small secreted protein
MKLLLPALCLLLAACSNDKGMGNDVAATAEEQTTEPMRPGVRAVRIGEGGPGFRACAYTARVVNVGSAETPYLPVRQAPFQDADEVLRLSNDARLFACTRSIDQRWQGVVIPPADAPDTECGVTAPVATVRDYAGPCRSGWVASAFVRLTAN